MTQNQEFRWGQFREMPESDRTFERDGDEIPWSERFEGWWDVDGVLGAETLSVTVVEIGPDRAPPMHAHEDPVEEMYLVVEGTVDIEIKDPDTGEVEVVEGATPGTFAYFPPGVEHRPINNYDEPTVQLGFRAMPEQLGDLQDRMRVPDDE